MPRKPRHLTEAGIYHVICRGNNRQTLFLDTGDYHEYLTLLLEMKSFYDFNLYHYCLMPNHVHLLLGFKNQESFQKIMQRVNLTYAKRFKKMYHYHGHVFQDRFKSLAIDQEAYLLDCGRYIERNPFKARLVENLVNYSWSSYHYYAYGQANLLLTENPLYESLGTLPEQRQQNYREYILVNRPYEELIDEGLMKG